MPTSLRSCDWTIIDDPYILKKEGTTCEVYIDTIYASYYYMTVRGHCYETPTVVVQLNPVISNSGTGSPLMTGRTRVADRPSTSNALIAMKESAKGIVMFVVKYPSVLIFPEY